MQRNDKVLVVSSGHDYLTPAIVNEVISQYHVGVTYLDRRNSSGHDGQVVYGTFTANELVPVDDPETDSFRFLAMSPSEVARRYRTTNPVVGISIDQDQFFQLRDLAKADEAPFDELVSAILAEAIEDAKSTGGHWFEPLTPLVKTTPKQVLKSVVDPYTPDKEGQTRADKKAEVLRNQFRCFGCKGVTPDITQRPIPGDLALSGVVNTRPYCSTCYSRESELARNFLTNNPDLDLAVRVNRSGQLIDHGPAKIAGVIADGLEELRRKLAGQVVTTTAPRDVDDPSPRLKVLRVCDECGKAKADVDVVVDPYESDLRSSVVLGLLCPPCVQERANAL